MTARAGHQNWLELELHVVERPARSTFKVNFRHTHRPKEMDFQSAADYTAGVIAERFDNLFLGLSGGLDSEFIAEVLYRNQIPFTPIVGINLQNRDHYFALDWCRKHRITPLIFDFRDVQDLFFEEGIKFSRKTHLFGEGINLTLYLNRLARSSDGHLITGEPTLPQVTDDYYSPCTETFDMYFYALGMEWLGHSPGAFFSYTPEILLAQARELDCNLHESAAKADLYQIPYRPKMDINDYQVTNQKIRDAFGHFCRLDQYDVPDGCVWTRAELIQCLQKPGK